MLDNVKRFFLFALLMLFCFMFVAQNALAAVDENQLHQSFVCQGSGSCGQTAVDTDCWYDQGTKCNWDNEQCGSWQKCSSDKDNYMQCACDPQCLAFPQGPQYYDSPSRNSGQMQNPNDVKLPVMLAWNNVPAGEISATARRSTISRPTIVMSIRHLSTKVRKAM